MIPEETKIARLVKAKETRERNKALKQSAIQNLRDQISVKFPMEPIKHFDGICFDSFLKLKALLVPYLSDKNKLITFLNGDRVFTSAYYTSSIFPKGDDADLMLPLWERNYISLDPSSPLSAFFCDEGVIVDFDYTKVSYRLNIENIEELLSKEDEFYADAKYMHEMYDINIFEDLCDRIFQAEVTEYFIIEMRMLHPLFEYDYEKHYKTIMNMLKQLSVEQCFNLITMSVKGALYFGEKHHCTKKHTINIALCNLTKYLEKSLIEGWTIKAFERGRNNPKSIIRLLIDEVIKNNGPS